MKTSRIIYRKLIWMIPTNDRVFGFYFKCVNFRERWCIKKNHWSSKCYYFFQCIFLHLWLQLIFHLAKLKQPKLAIQKNWFLKRNLVREKRNSFPESDPIAKYCLLQEIALNDLEFDSRYLNVILWRWLLDIPACAIKIEPYVPKWKRFTKTNFWNDSKHFFN